MKKRCIHLGAPTRGTRDCTTCGGGKAIPTHACAVHGVCTTLRIADNTAWCRTCKERKEVEVPYNCNDAGPDMSVADMVDLIRNAPPGPWPSERIWDAGPGLWRDVPEKTWHCWANTQEAMRILAQEYIDAYLPRAPRPAYTEERGIVLVGGAGPVLGRGLPHGYFPCLWVTLNKIRRMGTKLPIQVWYMGELEIDPYVEKLLATLDVECIDARKYEKQYPCRILCGWELKLYATLYSPFREVLFLDADCVPVNQPVEALFEDPAYRELGAMFFPDYDYWALDENVFRIFGIEPYRREPALETGQFLVNKTKSWKELRLALWYAEYSDFTFGHVYGDKECPHLAWRKLKTEYAIPCRGPGWDGNLCIVQHNMRGERILLHRCRDKWQLDGGNHFIAGLEDEELHHILAASLRGVWSGKLWHNHAPNAAEAAIITSLTGRRFEYRRLPKEGFAGESRILCLEKDGRVGEGAAECEVRWDVHERRTTDGSSVMTLALCREDKPTCILVQEENGAWRGSWLEYERCEVVLKPCKTQTAYDLRDVINEIADLMMSRGYEWNEALAAGLLSLLDPTECAPAS